ncbi:MAG: peptidylprolyl isomerase [Nitrospiraceae bacterium]
MRLVAMAGLVLTVEMGGASWAADQPAAEKEPINIKNARAIIQTKFRNAGDRSFCRMLLPKHVENFIKLAKSGLYNGTIFIRSSQEGS